VSNDDPRYTSVVDGSGVAHIAIQGIDGLIYEYQEFVRGSIPEKIKVGTIVAQGQQIGKFGDGGGTGAHLHYGVGKTIDGVTGEGANKNTIDPGESLGIGKVADVGKNGTKSFPWDKIKTESDSKDKESSKDDK
jgi:hypothetical protein